MLGVNAFQISWDLIKTWELLLGIKVHLLTLSGEAFSTLKVHLAVQREALGNNCGKHKWNPLCFCVSKEVPSTTPSQRALIWEGFTLWIVLSSLSRIIDFWLGRKSSCRLVFEVLKSSWKGRTPPQTSTALPRTGCWRLHYTGIDVTAVPVWTTLFLPPPVANQRKSGNQWCCLFRINKKVI